MARRQPQRGRPKLSGERQLMNLEMWLPETLPSHDKHGRDSFARRFKTSVRIETADPFPVNNVRRARFEGELPPA